MLHTSTPFFTTLYIQEIFYLLSYESINLCRCLLPFPSIIFFFAVCTVLHVTLLPLSPSYKSEYYTVYKLLSNLTFSEVSQCSFMRSLHMNTGFYVGCHTLFLPRRSFTAILAYNCKTTMYLMDFLHVEYY